MPPAHVPLGSAWDRRSARTRAHSLAGMGLMHLIRSDTTGAMAYLELAVVQEPSPASAWFNLARIHLARGESRLAARELRQFVTLAGARSPREVQWAEGTIAALGDR